MRNLIAAIDLGTTKVVCLVGEKTTGGIKIIAFSQAPSKGVMRGEVVNIQHVLDSMTPTIKEVESTIGEKINEVFVGIAGQNIRCATNGSQTIRPNPEELISTDEIESLTRSMYGTFCQGDEEVLHAIPQSYNIDDFMGVNEPIGMIGKQISASFKLFIGKKNSAQYSNNVIKRAGLKLKELVLEPLASAMAILSEEEMEVGVAMVDIGGGTSDLLIIQDNIIRHAAVIPFGGNSITEDIRIGCGISTKHAEQLKIDHGSCFSAYAPENKRIVIPGLGGRESREISFKLLANIIEARVSEIMEAIDYEIEKSGYKKLIKGGLVLTGGSSQIANICQLSNLITGLETRIAVPDMVTASDSVTDIYKPTFSTAIGLILKGFDRMEREGSVYNTTTPIKVEEPVTVEVADEGSTTAGKARKEKKSSFSFSKLISSLNSEKMFVEDNEA
ncbi:MAG: cell division protein FtsA [Bacteroidales bacterium]